MRISTLLSAAVLTLGLVLAGIPAASAATEAPYSEAAFKASQKQGKPILVHITATWCPTCAQQHPILSKLEADPKFKDLMVYDVDFDSQKDVVNAMGARMQSTLIVFNGSTERGRSTGDTNAGSIRELVEKSGQ